ncbi:hypothetical protein LTR94_031232, partial [Friedmanniomyces endolithicus]
DPLAPGHQRQRWCPSLRDGGRDGADVRRQHAAAPVRPQPREHRRGAGRLPGCGCAAPGRPPGGPGRSRRGAGAPRRLREPGLRRRCGGGVCRGGLPSVADRIRSGAHLPTRAAGHP